MTAARIADRRTVVLYRTLAAVFGIVACFSGAVFVRGLGRDEIHSGVLLIAFLGATGAIGLWRMRRWGRSLALIVALANTSLGALALLATILDQRSSSVGPAAFFAGNAALAFALTRPVFGLPEDG